MPKITETRYTVDIRESRGHGDLPALLDMLRYEGGRVIDWNIAVIDNSFSVTIQVPSFRYAPERWQSFGIRPYNVEVI